MSSTTPHPAHDPRPRAMAFVDAQNLFHDAERQFGYTHPNFDIVKLCGAVCEPRGWRIAGIRFYTGVPSESQNWRYKFFWDKKIFGMKLAKVEVITRKLKTREVGVLLYGNLIVSVPPASGRGPRVGQPQDAPWVTHSGRALPDGTLVEQEVYTEKGIDVSIAVDAIRCALEDRYDVGLFFSQDADLGPAVKEVKVIGRARGVFFTLASAFPSNGGGSGIPETLPIRIDRATYDACIDPKDYFPKHPRPYL